MLAEENYAPVCLVACVIIFISSFLVGFSWRTVDYDQYGIVVNEISRAVVSEQVYDSGRHFVGLGNVFETFNKTVTQEEWLGSGNSNEPGGEAGKTTGPITIRTKDGQRLDLDISFQYQIEKEKVLQLYHSYGRSYREFFVAIGRARLRDRASVYSSQDFFSKRMVIESDFSSTISKELVSRFVKLVDLQLRSVRIPRDLEVQLKQIQLNEIEHTLITAQLETDKILKTTVQKITTLTAKRDATLLNLSQTVYNDIESINKKLKREEELTATFVQYERSKMDASLRTYMMDTSAHIEAIKGQEQVELATTDLQVAAVTTEINLLQASRDHNATIISATADRDASKNQTAGNALVIKEKSNATKAGMMKFKSDAGFDGEDVVAYEFSRMVGNHPTKNLKMDMQKPSSLFLPGQKTAQTKNLKDQHVGLV